MAANHDNDDESGNGLETEVEVKKYSEDTETRQGEQPNKSGGDVTEKDREGGKAD